MSTLPEVRANRRTSRPGHSGARSHTISEDGEAGYRWYPASISSMDFRTLGATGIKVSPLCLGAMMFGAVGNPDHEDCVRIVHRAIDAGINFIDTADAYSRGESEEIAGK